MEIDRRQFAQACHFRLVERRCQDQPAHQIRHLDRRRSGKRKRVAELDHPFVFARIQSEPDRFCRRKCARAITDDVPVEPNDECGTGVRPVTHITQGAGECGLILRRQGFPKSIIARQDICRTAHLPRAQFDNLVENARTGGEIAARAVLPETLDTDVDQRQHHRQHCREKACVKDGNPQLQRSKARQLDFREYGHHRSRTATL